MLNIISAEDRLKEERGIKTLVVLIGTMYLTQHTGLVKYHRIIFGQYLP